MTIKKLTLADYERLRLGDEVHLRCIVTPQLAEKMIANMPHNRSLIESHVENLTGIINSGRWEYDACPIQVGFDGTTFGGKHRLTACVRSGKPIDVLVVFGLDPSTITNSYVSRPWHLGHFFDYRGEKYTRRLAAAIVHLNRFEAGCPTNQNIKPTADAALDILERHPAIRESVAAVEQASKILPSSIAAITHYYFRQKDAPLCEMFFAGLSTGASLDNNSPILILRNRLLENRSDKKSKLKKQEVMALTIKAWNHCREGRMKIHSLRWGAVGKATEAFPAIK